MTEAWSFLDNFAHVAPRDGGDDQFAAKLHSVVSTVKSETERTFHA
jgi:hypothetical protein